MTSNTAVMTSNTTVTIVVTPHCWKEYHELHWMNFQELAATLAIPTMKHRYLDRSGSYAKSKCLTRMD